MQVFCRLLAECKTHGHPANEPCAACVQPLTAAVALYKNDFLAGFSLRDSPEFDDWQVYQSDALRHDFADTLEALTLCYSSAHRFDAALLYARRWLALDRLHEPAHRQLMLLYTWDGKRAAALRQYRECVQTLEQELGVSPLEATTRLYQLIKENQLPPLPPPLSEPILAPEEQQMDNAAAPTTKTPSSIQSPRQTSAIEGYPLAGFPRRVFDRYRKRNAEHRRDRLVTDRRDTRPARVSPGRG